MYENMDLLENLPNSKINLELYVDESKQRQYNGETITYIMIMAIPSDKKEYIFSKLNNARCLNEKPQKFETCTNNCRYHSGNNIEIHYSKINTDRITNIIAQRWLDILLQNNFKNDNAIFFNILGINETNINLEFFGSENQFGNIYCRFFRTALLRLLRMFNSYDEIIVDKIYHDSTNEMEEHPYFKTSAIKNITLQELIKEERKIFFKTSFIEFIDSNHKQGLLKESQFIQFVDLILGCTTNAIHNSANNINKKALTEKIYPLVYRILSPKPKFNSSYNYFNKQSISFFPKYTKEKLEEFYGTLSNEVLERILHSSANFENTKPLLFKPDDGQQSFFDF